MLRRASESYEFILRINTVRYIEQAWHNRVFPEDKPAFIARLPIAPEEVASLEVTTIEPDEDDCVFGESGISFDFTGCGFVNLERLSLSECASDVADVINEFPKLTEAVLRIRPTKTLIVPPNNIGGSRSHLFIEKCDRDLCLDIREWHADFYQDEDEIPSFIWASKISCAYATIIVADEIDSCECEVAICPKKPARLHDINFIVAQWYPTVEAFTDATGHTIPSYLASHIDGFDWPFSRAKTAR